MNTLVVNLYAGPGAGKSTGAAYIFSKLKMNGISSEYVTEFAKDKTWEGSAISLNCQFYISGKQAFRLARVNGKVQVIITDSPLILGAIYTSDEYIKDACYQESLKYPWQLNFFLERKFEYHHDGRIQTEEQAKSIDNKIKNILNMHNISYECIDGTEDGFNLITNKIINELAFKSFEET